MRNRFGAETTPRRREGARLGTGYNRYAHLLPSRLTNPKSYQQLQFQPEPQEPQLQSYRLDARRLLLTAADFEELLEDPN